MMRRSGTDREERRVTGRRAPNQAWEKAAEQLDTNDPSQRDSRSIRIHLPVASRQAVSTSVVRRPSARASASS